jgi:phosphoglycerate dehydrogenase-like enzyme
MLYHRLHTIAIRTHVEQEWIQPSSIGGNFIRELNTLTIGIVGYGHIGAKPLSVASLHGAMN